MTDRERDQLYSPNPQARLDEARSASESLISECVPVKNDWIRNAFGAANAWVVVVGPSPGRGPGGKVIDPVPPCLGTVHPLFQQFERMTAFWGELFRLLRQGFQYAGIAKDDANAALKLTMLLNLDTEPEGDSTKISYDKLEAGLTRLQRVLDLTKPRVVLALEQRVYETIGSWSTCLSEIGAERKHEKVSKFTPKSRWLTYKGRSFLLTKTLQHPSKKNFYLGFETEVANSLGALFAEAAQHS